MAEKEEAAGGTDDESFDLAALDVLREILGTRRKRRGEIDTSEDLADPFDDEPPPKPPVKKKPPEKKKPEHPMDNYARDGRRRRL